MHDRIAEAQRRYEDLSVQLADPNIHADPGKLRDLSREHSRLAEIVEAAARLDRAEQELAGAREMLDDAGGDPELAAMARDEAERLTADVARLEGELKVLLIPRDPLDDRDAVVEVRAGTGGDEAALFAGDLFRMYQRFADRRGWKVELVSVSEGTAGGYKEAIFVVRGNAYGDLRYESGVHRVQRVPATETQGRIHTSAATVAVLPEAEEVDVQINPNELKIDVYRSSGPGGQSVNTTDSAVRITHLPTGLVVTCQDEKSQHKNKDKAMGVLRSRLLDIRIAEQEAERARDRKAQVGTGDRSAKIRTYNFPQSRVTDHRIGFTTHALQQVIDGSLEEMIESLKLARQEERE
jgi:peptide chain release factor 1